MTTHRVPSDVFDALACGGGDIGGVLRAGQRSKRLLLLRELVSATRTRAPTAFAEARMAEAYAVLVAAQRRSPVAVDDVLLQPHVGAWATHCLRRLVSDGSVPAPDLGYVGSVAASAALRAGLAFEVTASLRDGLVMLPTYGAVRFVAGDGWCRIRSRSGAGGVEVTSLDGGARTAVSFDGASGQGSRWLPLRRLRSTADGLTIDVSLDDLDPYRGCEDLPTTDRLGPSTVEDWQAKMDEAWSLLVGGHRPWAEAVGASVTCVVPLRFPGSAEALSGSRHEAVGAVAMTPPPDALTLVLALVHELGHTKLCALLDLVPLLGRTGGLFHAPWRRDPRPLRGLLQGAYAYLGLTAFWEAHRRHPSLTPAERDVAHFEFALVRDQVRHAVDELRSSGSLTPAGARFAEGMARTLSTFEERSVPPLPRSLAQLACLDNRIGWRLRNLRPDAGQVAAWASDWLGGQPFSWSAHGDAGVTDGEGPLPSQARLGLIRRRLASPDRWRDGANGASDADLELVAGRSTSAADAYLAEIERAPDDLSSWAGLALARRHAPSPRSRALTTVPEALRALHREIRDRCGAAPDPEDLAHWVGNGVAKERRPDRAYK